MPDADGDVVISHFGAGLTARGPFSQHHFVGGNEFLLKMLRDNVNDFDLTASSNDFEDTLVRVFDQLRSFISLSIVSAEIVDDTLTVRVRVENAAGHKFPTGFPSRRAWLHLTVTDADGQTVFESGGYSEEGGIAGNDADDDAGVYEPHYDTITSSDQVQIYEPILKDTRGEPTYILLRAAGYAKDNRILPPGFDKADVDPDIAVYGQASADANFTGGSDEVAYEIHLDHPAASHTINVQLLFQSVSHRYAAEIRHAETELAHQFDGLYEKADKTPAVIASLKTTIE
jgi:hypothetical protein